MLGTLRIALLFVLLGACLMAAPARATPPIEHWQTAAGTRVYFIETHDLPMLDVSVDFPAGSVFDTAEKSGLAALTQRLLRLGAAGLTEDEIARRVADTGAQLNGRFDSDRGGMALRTLTSADELKQALDVLGRVLQAPVFPDAVLAREKARVIATLRDQDTKPEAILNKAFSALIYGRHPYALRAAGEPDSVARLTRDDVLAFYRSHYAADQAVISIIGDVSRAQAQALAAALTASLPRAGRAAVFPEVEDIKRAETRAIAHPALQSHVLVGAPGIRRGDPDYFPLYVGNYILGGGGFVSRIVDEVRSKRGLAYSAYSYFEPLKVRGPFVIGLQTRRDQAAAALEVVRSTVREFLAQGPTEQELTAAKQNIVGGFPLRIDSNRKLLDYLRVIGFYELPLTYLDDFSANVEKVTVADIRRAFAQHVDAAHLETVVVGADEAMLRASAKSE